MTAAVLKNNVEINGLTSQVSTHNVALSGDGRLLRFWSCSDLNIGRHGIYEPQMPPFSGEDKNCEHKKPQLQTSLTLQQVMEAHDITHIAVFKLDCEGCEWEIFPQVNLSRIDQIACECHEFPGLKLDVRSLALCRKYCVGPPRLKRSGPESWISLPSITQLEVTVSPNRPPQSLQLVKGTHPAHACADFASRHGLSYEQEQRLLRTLQVHYPARYNKLVDYARHAEYSTAKPEAPS